MGSFKVEFKKELYDWAISESGKSIDEIRLKFNKIDKWITGEDSPTFEQSKQLAEFLGVTHGLMFLNKPPQTKVIDIVNKYCELMEDIDTLMKEYLFEKDKTEKENLCVQLESKCIEYSAFMDTDVNFGGSNGSL